MSASGVVLQVCPNDHPPFKQICDLYAEAAASIGVDLHTVYLSPSRSSTRQPPESKVHYLDAPSLKDTRDVVRRLHVRIADITPADNFSLCLCHRYRAYAVVQASRIARRKTIAVAHEFGFFRRVTRRINRRFGARWSSSDVHFAGVSTPVVEELRKEDKAALLLPNAINLAQIQSEQVDRSAARGELGVAQNTFVVGVVGRLHHKKQPELALAGYAAFATQHPNTQLVFVGDGEKREQLEFSVQQMFADNATEQNPPKVIFTGNVARGYRYFRAFDVLLVAAGPQEAFGMVLLEAMAAQVLSVVGPAPGPRSVVGDLAIAFEAYDAQSVADALQRVYKLTPHQAEDLRTQQLSLLAKEYSVASVARRLDALLVG